MMRIQRAAGLLPDSLIGRSFVLIALLLIFSVLASFQIYRVHEREPRARELAQQTISVVNLTRAALVSAAPASRRSLLRELNEREGIRVFPSVAGEVLSSLPAGPLFAMVSERVRAELGSATRFAFSRDAEQGFWVSFLIDGDEFWVMLPRERLAPRFGLGWLGWGLGLLVLALAGAWLIASRLTRSLAALSRAAQLIGRGESPRPLTESGPRELRAVSAAFNRMTHDLSALERERANVLAGISHDLRTPLSRLRLELEMSGAQEHAARSMAADIEEIDTIIGQFLDYARGEAEASSETDLDDLLAELAEHYTRRADAVQFVSGGPCRVRVAPTAIRRAVANLVDNALRHAGGPVEIGLRLTPGEIRIEVRDRGPGIPVSEIDRLKLPFTRLTSARSGAGGSGLGLAIVERIARMHGGRLELLPREGGGLCARVVLQPDDRKQA